MKKITAHGNLSITSEETDIQLAAGAGRLIMKIQVQGKRLPVHTMRRAMAYRKFLTVLDMPVYVYVNNKRILKLNGKKYWIYRPFLVTGWILRNFFSN